MISAVEFISKVKSANGECLSYRHGNSSGILWEMLWKYTDGKFSGKVCAPGCFVDWQEWTEIAAIKRVQEDFEVIRSEKALDA